MRSNAQHSGIVGSAVQSRAGSRVQVQYRQYSTGAVHAVEYRYSTVQAAHQHTNLYLPVDPNSINAISPWSSLVCSAPLRTKMFRSSFAFEMLRDLSLCVWCMSVRYTCGVCQFDTRVVYVSSIHVWCMSVRAGLAAWQSRQYIVHST
jgi:hypothetical protein